MEVVNSQPQSDAQTHGEDGGGSQGEASLLASDWKHLLQILDDAAEVHAEKIFLLFLRQCLGVNCSEEPDDVELSSSAEVQQIHTVEHFNFLTLTNWSEEEKLHLTRIGYDNFVSTCVLYRITAFCINNK